ncbi:DUF1844 domain-containing protein [uncultured Mailhella sp.]|uniref:DUF1844 domain-containing protein n=1 Tax=uncultured Mailhella sp. TaxID=1981031 RepID=UPI0025E7F430|nr:DUF1844 domain-containing protein [uncultured Mailhella sp.]
MSDKNDSATVLPEVTFSTFVLSLASSALVHLGEVPNPETGGTSCNEALARNAIDVLTMLDDKTRNGLTPEESKLMRDVLYELRVKFVARS